MKCCQVAQSWVTELQINKDPSQAQETDETVTVTRRWGPCGLWLWGFQEEHSCNQGSGPCVEN